MLKTAFAAPAAAALRALAAHSRARMSDTTGTPPAILRSVFVGLVLLVGASGSVAAQTSQPASATSLLPTLAVLAVFGVVAVRVFTDRQPLSMLRASVSGASSGVGSVPTPDPGFGLGRTRTLIIGAVGVLIVAVFTGAFALPSDVRVPLAAVGVLLATYLTLRALGAYSFRLFALVGSAVVVLGLSALGEPIIGSIVNSPVGPIAVVGGLYLGYRAVTGGESG